MGVLMKKTHRVTFQDPTVQRPTNPDMEFVDRQAPLLVEISPNKHVDLFIFKKNPTHVSVKSGSLISC